MVKSAANGKFQYEKRFLQASKCLVPPFSANFYPSVQNQSTLQLIYHHTRYGGATALSLPHTRYDMSSPTPSSRGGSAFLIGDHCPSFSNLDTAVFRLLYDAEWQPGQDALYRLWVIRIAHAEAWIEHLKLSPSSVAVTIAGSDVKDSRIEVIDSTS